jgi:heme exporter protein B
MKPNMPTSLSIWVERVSALFLKEIKSELRTRYAFNSLLMFSVVTLTAVSFSVGQFALSVPVKSALYWLILFFASMAGLAQVFIKEEEAKTSYLLKLASPPTIIYLGKFLYNWVLLLALQVIIIPLFVIFLNLELVNLILFLTVSFLGSLALSAATTIIGAIVSKANVKGALFAVLSFPLLIPVLVAGIEGAQLATSGARFSEAWGQIRLLLSYSVVMLTVSIILFEFVWSE